MLPRLRKRAPPAIQGPKEDPHVISSHGRRRSPLFFSKIDAATRRNTEISVSFLQDVPLLRQLQIEELRELAPLCKMLIYEEDEVITTHEEALSKLFIIETGEVSRLVHSPGPSGDGAANWEERGNLSRYDHFGALSIVSSKGEKRREEMERDLMQERDIRTRIVARRFTKCIVLDRELVALCNLRPSLEYDFALILRRDKREEEAQLDLLRRLISAELRLTELQPTRTSQDYIVLLLHAPEWLVEREDRLLRLERMAELYSEEEMDSVMEERKREKRRLSPAERLEALGRLLCRSSNVSPPGAGLSGIEENTDPAIHAIFPLHDPHFNNEIMGLWRSITGNSARKNLVLLRFKNHFGLKVAFYFHFVSHYVDSLKVIAIVGTLLWLSLRWLDYRLYASCLSLFGLLVALVWAPCMLKVWERLENKLRVRYGVMFYKEAEEENPQFKHYRIRQVNIAEEGEPPEYVEVKEYSALARTLKRLLSFLFALICISVVIVLVALFAQWYIIAVMTPQCGDPRCSGTLSSCLEACRRRLPFSSEYGADCEAYCALGAVSPPCSSFLGCFPTATAHIGSARWLYILVQGIILGLAIDILFTAFFDWASHRWTLWENWRTLQEREYHYTLKTFIFVWTGYFSWFFLLAFVYTPYGAELQHWIKENVDSNELLTFRGRVLYAREWREGRLAMDKAFVTPLIVTQLLNLIVNTFAPVLLRKAVRRGREHFLSTSDAFVDAGRAVKMYVGNRVKRNVNQQEKTEENAALPKAMVGSPSLEEEDERIISTVEEGSLPPNVALESSDPWYQRMKESLSSSQTRFASSAGACRDLSSRLRLKKEWNCRDLCRSSTEILELSSFSSYSPFEDFLRMALQFSVVTMFSIVWPFCALCALLHNLAAQHFDAVRICIDYRRAMPQRAHGIGQWERIFLSLSSLSLAVAVGLFVNTTGGLDVLWGCPVSEETYGPVQDCLTNVERLIAFSLLEHLTLLSLFLLRSSVHGQSAALRVEIKRRSRRQKAAVHRSMQMIGREILVEGERDGRGTAEFYSAVVLWVGTDKLQVSFSGVCPPALSPSGSPSSVSPRPDDGGKEDLERREPLGFSSSLSSSLSSSSLLSWHHNSKDVAVWVPRAKCRPWVPTMIDFFEVGASVLISDPSEPGLYRQATISKLLDYYPHDSSPEREVKEEREREGRGERLVFTPDILCLYVIGAKRLPSSSSLLNDRYCEIRCSSSLFHTSVRWGTTQPRWGERFEVPVTDKRERVTITVYNRLMGGGRKERNGATGAIGSYVGEVVIPLAELAGGKVYHAILQLKRRKFWEKRLPTSLSLSSHSAAERDIAGEIELRLQWIDSRLPTRVAVTLYGRDREKEEIWLTREEALQRLHLSAPDK